MDSILVVCYSYTGVSRRAAQLLCTQEGWPLGTVKDERPRGAVRCILDSLFRRRPEVRYEGPDPADFRTVVLVSPIWAGRLAGPMRSFVVQNRSTLRRVAVISTMGSNGSANAVAEIARLLEHAPVLSAALTQRSFEDGSAAPQLRAFGEQLRPAAAAPRTAARAMDVPDRCEVSPPLYVQHNEP